MSTALFLLGAVLVLLSIAFFIGAIVLIVLARRRSAPSALTPPGAAEPDAPLQPAAPPPSDEELAAAAPTLYVPLPGEIVSHGRIEWIAGPLSGQTHELTDEGFTVGREAGAADVVIASPSISKKHLWIGVRDGEPVVVDQGSTNGTFLGRHGGERVSTHRLTAEDIVVVANDAARFRYVPGVRRFS